MVDKHNENVDSLLQRGQTFRCFLCGTTYPFWNDFRSHFQQSHMEEDDEKWQITCQKCDKTFTKTKHLEMVMLMTTFMDHMVLKHEMAVPDFAPIYRCLQPECSYWSLVREHFQKHSHVHSPNLDYIQCEQCSKVLKKRNLLRHKNFCEAGTKERQHKCIHCGKTYLVKDSLMIHLNKIHKKQPSHLCSKCSVTFFSNYELDLHMLIKHDINETGRDTAQCPLCQFKTFAGSSIKTHIEKVHGNTTFPCKECSKTFKTTSQ